MPNDADVKARRNARRRAKWAADPDSARAAQRVYYAKNKERYQEHSRRWTAEHPEKRREAEKRWHAKNPDWIAANRRRRLYNLTPEAFAAMSEAQGGACAICAEIKTLVVDHDHATNGIRGLLCHSCNRMLGHAKDDSQRFEAAIAYLKRE